MSCLSQLYITVDTGMANVQLRNGTKGWYERQEYKSQTAVKILVGLWFWEHFKVRSKAAHVPGY